jgi:hypothetical protein
MQQMQKHLSHPKCSAVFNTSESDDRRYFHILLTYFPVQNSNYEHICQQVPETPPPVTASDRTPRPQPHHTTPASHVTQLDGPYNYHHRRHANAWYLVGTRSRHPQLSSSPRHPCRKPTPLLQ